MIKLVFFLYNRMAKVQRLCKLLLMMVHDQHGATLTRNAFFSDTLKVTKYMQI